MLGTRIQHQLRLVRPTIPLASHRTTPPNDDLDLPGDSIDRTTPVERTAPPSRGPVGAPGAFHSPVGASEGVLHTPSLAPTGVCNTPLPTRPLSKPRMKCPCRRPRRLAQR